MTYWLMDMNPDQLVAMGLARPDAASVRAFEALNRFTLASADEVVVLDRFMRERALRKLDVAHKTRVMPPWSHDEGTRDLPHADNPFRSRHGMDGRFVVMYSGNHSPANPLGTLLDAAARVADDPRFLFAFIGGGAGKAEIERRIAAGATNLLSLPYQPLEALPQSLSAADVHVASIGNEVVGIVHPCKAYGAMAVSRPVLVLGPDPSHLADLVREHRIGWSFRHGDVAGVEAALREMAASPPGVLAAMGQRARVAIGGDLGRVALRARFCDVVLSTIRARG
jgi:hypothetical protein